MTRKYWSFSPLTKNIITDSLINSKLCYQLTPMVLAGIMKEDQVNSIHSYVLKKTLALPKNLAYRTILKEVGIINLWDRLMILSKTVNEEEDQI